MNLTEARAALVTALEAKTATLSDDGVVDSVSVGTASNTDVRACLQFMVDRHKIASKAITDQVTHVRLFWTVGGVEHSNIEKMVQRYASKHLDPSARDRNDIIPRALYPKALARLSELYAQLYG